MSREIDERVVQLILESDQFQQSANEAIDTMGRLNSSIEYLEDRDDSGLNNAFKGFNRTIRGIAPIIETETKRLTTMQIMGITSIQNITNSMVNTLKRTLKSFTLDDVMAGFSKYGEKTRSIGTLKSQGYELNEINQEVDRLRLFADETSYSLLQMTDTIGKFTATGMGLSDARQAVQGIALWAATAGQNAATASRAMVQLAQGIPSGRIRYEDWRSIMTNNMDTESFHEAAAAAAVQKKVLTDLGNGLYEINENGKQFNLAQLFSSEGLTRGEWFTTDVFLETMKTYNNGMDTLYDKMQEFNTGKSTDEMITFTRAIEMFGNEIDEFGLNAVTSAQEARTLEDAIEATKDAVSSQWMGIYEKIFGQYDDAKDLWTDLSGWWYDIFAGPLEKFNFVLDEWNKGWGEFGSGRDLLIAGFWDLVEAVGYLVEPIQTFWRAIFPPTSAKTLYSLTLKFKVFAETMKNFLAPIEEIAEETKDAIDGVTKPVKTAVEAAQELEEIANRVISGEFGNGEVRFKALDELGYSWKEVQNKVNEMLNCNFRYEMSEEDLAKSIFNQTDATEEAEEQVSRLEQAREELIDVTSELRLLEDRKHKDPTLTTDAYEEEHKKLTERADALTDEIETIEELTATEENARKRYEALFTIIANVRNVSQTVADGFKKLMDSLRDSTSWFHKTIISRVINWILQIGAFGSTVLGDLVEKVKGAFQEGHSGSKLLGKIKKKIEDVGSAIDQVMDKLPDIWGNIKGFGSGAFNKAKEIFGRFVSRFKVNEPKFTKLGDKLKEIGDRIKEFASTKFEQASGTIGAFFQKLGGDDGLAWVDWCVDKLGDGAEWLSKTLGWLIDHTGSISEFFGIFTDSLSSRITGIFDSFSKATESENAGEMIDSMERASTALKDTSESVSNLQGGLTGLIEFIEKPFKKINEKITEFGNTFAVSFDEETIDKWWGRLEKLAMGLIGFKLVDSLNNFSLIAAAFAKIPLMFAGVLESFNDLLHKASMEIVADSFKKFASGVLMIAASVYLLSMADSDKIEKATAAVIAILGVSAFLIMVATKLYQMWLTNAPERAAQKVAKVQNKLLAILDQGIFTPINLFFTKKFPKTLNKAVVRFTRPAILLAYLAFIAGIAGLIYAAYKIIQDMNGDKFKENSMVMAFISIGILLAAITTSYVYIEKAMSGVKAGSGLAMLASMAALAILIKIVKGVMEDIVGLCMELFSTFKEFTGKKYDSDESHKAMVIFFTKIGAALGAIAAVAWVIKSMEGISKILPENAEKMGFSQFSGMATTLVAFAFSFVLIIGAVSQVIKTISEAQKEMGAWGAVGATLTAFFAVFLALGAVVYAVNHIKFEASMLMPIITLAAGMWVFAKIISQIADLAPAIAKVAKPLTTLVLGIGAVVFVFTLLDALIGEGGEAAKALERTAKAMIWLGAGLAVIAVGLGAIVAVVALFNEFKSKIGDGSGFVWFAVAIAAIIGALTVIDARKGGKMSDSLIKFAKAMMYVGVALLAAGAGFILIGRSLPDFAQSLADFGTVLKKNWKEIILAVGALALLGFAFGKFAGLIGKFLKPATEETEKSTKGIFGKFKDFGKNLKDFFSNEKYQMAASIIGAIIFGLGALEAYAPEITESIITALVGIINGVTNAINTHGSAIAQALVDLIQAIVGVLTDALETVWDETIIGKGLNWLQSLGIPGLEEAATAVDSLGKAALNLPAWLVDPEGRSDKMMKSVTEPWAEYIVRAADKKDQQRMANVTGEFDARAQAEAAAAARAHGSTKVTVNEPIKIDASEAPVEVELPTDAANVEVTNGSSFAEAATNKVGGVVDGFIDKISGTMQERMGGGEDGDFFNNMVNKLMGENPTIDVGADVDLSNLDLSNPEVQAYLQENGIDIGEAWSEQIANGASDDDSIYKINTATEEVTNGAISAASNAAAANAPGIGMQIADGLISGLGGKVTDLFGAGALAANTILDGAASRRGADIGSPSKKGRILGAFIGEGLIGGTDSKLTGALAAGTRLGTSAIDGLLYAINNPDAIPTIRPVFDGGSVGSGLSNLESTLYNRKLNLATDVGDLNGINRQLLAQLQAVQLSNEISTNEIIKMRQDMLAMRGDLDQLGNRISGMSVRLDGKSVVGGIIEDVDKKLGQRASRRLK